MNLRKLYKLLYAKLKPMKYMERVGVNFPRGEGTPIWEDRLGNRTVDYHDRQ